MNKYVSVNDCGSCGKDTIIDLYQCLFIVILGEQIVKTADFTAAFTLLNG